MCRYHIHEEDSISTNNYVLLTIMDIRLEPKDITDVYSTPIVQQTYYWSQVKAQLGMSSKAYDFSVRNSDLYVHVGGYAHTQADFIMFYQYLNHEDYIAYLPYGPETEPSEENQGRFLEELSETLRSYIPRHCVALRYDLNWKSHWCKADDFDAEGHWIGLPGKEFQEIQLNFGTACHNLRKANTNILPTNTIVLDMSCPEEEIINRMKSKTRYNIRLSQRHGIEVRSAGMEGLEEWYRLYCETALRNGLHLNDIHYFRSMFASKMECTAPHVNVQLLIAYYDKIPLAAMFLILSSHRATYLYGASSSNHRNLMPTYALQWRAIQIAREHNCIEYDMFGIAPDVEESHPMYGLYKFKRGFGGDIYHQLGCWDYPLEEDKYQYYSALEMSTKGYYE